MSASVVVEPRIKKCKLKLPNRDSLNNVELSPPRKTQRQARSKEALNTCRPNEFHCIYSLIIYGLGGQKCEATRN